MKRASCRLARGAFWWSLQVQSDGQHGKHASHALPPLLLHCACSPCSAHAAYFCACAVWQGKNKQSEHAGSTCCLLIFDLLYLNGENLTKRSQAQRRKTLEGALVQQPCCVELSKADRTVHAAKYLVAI